MYPKFATTSNVKRFLAAVDLLERRGAEEASWLVALGKPGLGKTRTLMWWAAQREPRGVYVRAKTNWRPAWMLSELVTELGLEPARRTKDLQDQVLEAIAISRRPIVIDEARAMLQDARLLETLRDITDQTEQSFILGGEDFVYKRIAARFPQISSRISEVVKFEEATLADVRACCEALAEVKIADDLVAEVHRQSLGYYREIKNAIAAIEVVGKRNKGKTVALSDMGGHPLCRNRHDASPRSTPGVR